MQRRQSAFTIVEISMVLVIVGLITGAVIIGRDLIFAADTHRQVAQIVQYNSAANAFKIKYDCLPGDCADAVEFKLATENGPGDHGNGNGALDHEPYTINGAELIDFWYHLSQAGLIADVVSGYIDEDTYYMPGVHTPALKMTGDNFERPPFATPGYNKQGGMWVFTVNYGAGGPPPSIENTAPDMSYINALFDGKALGKHMWFLTNDSGIINNRFGVYHAWRIYALDGKLDDGKPRSGSVRARPYKIFDEVLHWQEAKCTHETENRYYNVQTDFSGSSSGCVALIQTEF